MYNLLNDLDATFALIRKYACTSTSNGRGYRIQSLSLYTIHSAHDNLQTSPTRQLISSYETTTWDRHSEMTTTVKWEQSPFQKSNFILLFFFFFSFFPLSISFSSLLFTHWIPANVRERVSAMTHMRPSRFITRVPTSRERLTGAGNIHKSGVSLKERQRENSESVRNHWHWLVIVVSRTYLRASQLVEKREQWGPEFVSFLPFFCVDLIRGIHTILPAESVRTFAGRLMVVTALSADNRSSTTHAFVMPMNGKISRWEANAYGGLR